MEPSRIFSGHFHTVYFWIIRLAISENAGGFEAVAISWSNKPSIRIFQMAIERKYNWVEKKPLEAVGVDNVDIRVKESFSVKVQRSYNVAFFKRNTDYRVNIGWTWMGNRDVWWGRRRGY